MKSGSAKVVFTCFPMRNRGYFEWFYTGLQILEQQNRLSISHEGGSMDRFFRRHPRVFGKLLEKYPDSFGMLAPVDYFALAGRYERGGKVVTFAYDVTDAPFNYALAWLERSDLYFKMQCPSEWHEAGFPLSTTVRVPYHPEVLRSKARIRPMMSTGGITSTLNLARNLQVLEADRQRIAAQKKLRMFASFGSDRGPGPWKDGELPPAPHNYHNERSLIGELGGRIGHPNEKRGELVRRLRGWNKEEVDARIWNSRDPSIQGDALAWSDYLVRVSESVFNVNISGFRRSAPFRIIDTNGIDGSAAVASALLAQMLDSDLIVWAIRANRPARAPDVELLERFDAELARRPDRRRPPLIVAVTGIDLLLEGWPFPENRIPAAELEQVAAVLAAIRQDMGGESAIPLRAAPPTWNVDLLVASISDATAEALMTQRNRRRLEGHEHQSGWRSQLRRGASGTASLARLVGEQLRAGRRSAGP